MTTREFAELQRQTSVTQGQPALCPACGAERCRFAPDPEDDLGPLNAKSPMWLLNAEVHIQATDLVRLRRRHEKAQSTDEDRRLRLHLDHADARLVEAVLIREQARSKRTTRY